MLKRKIMHLVEYVAIYWDEEGDEGEIVKI